jgi:outer membrane cobalamin receptor
MDKHIWTRGLFAQDEMTITNQFSIVPGIRFDQHSEFNWAVSPKFGLNYKMNPDTRFYASAGRSFQAPTITQLFAPDYMPAPGVILRSNPDLDPEYIWSFDLGGEHKVTDNLTGHINAFHNDMNDLISYKTLSGGIRQYENIDKARSAGVELGVDYKTTEWLTSFVNYTYQDTENKETKDKLDYMPRNKANLGLRLDRKLGDWTLSGSVTEIYVGELAYNDWQSGQSNTLDSYWKTDLNFILADKQGLSIRVGVQNLTNKQYEDSGGYLAPGRLYSLSLDIKF